MDTPAIQELRRYLRQLDYTPDDASPLEQAIVEAIEALEAVERAKHYQPSGVRSDAPAAPSHTHAAAGQELAPGMQSVGVTLPPEVARIVQAAGGEAHLPMALAKLIGAMATLAVVLHRTLEREEYVGFADAVTNHLNTAKAIINSDDPDRAYREEAARQRRVN